MSDQCAIGPDGQLLDASKITWYDNPDDAQPIPQAPAPQSLGVPGPSSLLHRTLSSTLIASSTSASESSNPISFRVSRKPATVVAGVRCTTRVPRPSTGVLENQAHLPFSSRRSLGKGKAESSPENTASVDNLSMGSDVDTAQLKKLCVSAADTDGSEMDDIPDLVDNDDSDDEDEDEDAPTNNNTHDDNEEDAEGDDDDDEDEAGSGEDVEDAYQRTKSFGDSDHVAIC